MPSFVDRIMEFSAWLQAVSDVSKSSLTLEQKREQCGALLDTMSDDTYNHYFKRIMSIVQKNREECEPFKDTEEQVNNIMSWLPRLNDHREAVLEIIKDRRKKYKLNL